MKRTIIFIFLMATVFYVFASGAVERTGKDSNVSVFGNARSGYGGVENKDKTEKTGQDDLKKLETGLEVLNQKQNIVIPEKTKVIQSVSDEVPMKSSGWISADGQNIGNLSSLKVAKYMIRGEGPNGTQLPWTEINSDRLVLSNVERGEWKLFVEALNDSGDIIARGSIETFLSNDAPLTTISISEPEGYGAVDAVFIWSSSQVKNAKVRIFVKQYDGEFYERPAKEISVTKNQARWISRDIPSGNYVLKAELYDTEGIIGGCAVALRILNERISVGEIPIQIQKLPDKHGIKIEGSPAKKVEGYLNCNLETRKMAFVSTNFNESELVYDWYVDGQEIPGMKNAKTIDFSKLITKIGYHEIVCIPAKKGNYSSISTYDMMIGYNGTDYGYMYGTGIPVITEKGEESK